MDAKTAIFPIVLQRILKNAFANQSREFLIVYPSILRLNGMLFSITTIMSASIMSGTFFTTYCCFM